MRKSLARIIFLTLVLLLTTALTLPVLSQPPGRIAFQKFTGKTWDIWLVNADGSGLKQLTDSPANDTDPCWSPDGTRLVFVSERDGNKEIYVADAASGGLIRLTDNQAADFRPT